MANRNNFTVFVGLSIVVVAMLFGAFISAVIPSQADLAAESGSILAQAEDVNAGESFGPDETFGPLVVYALDAPQSTRQ